MLHLQDVTADPHRLLNASNEYPYIIIVDTTDINSSIPNARYYIVVENHPIPLDLNSTFLDTMDTFYKVHKILNLQFHPNLKILMHFIEYFIFNNEEKYIKVTPKMQEVSNIIYA